MLAETGVAAAIFGQGDQEALAASLADNTPRGALIE